MKKKPIDGVQKLEKEYRKEKRKCRAAFFTLILPVLFFGILIAAEYTQYLDPDVAPTGWIGGLGIGVLLWIICRICGEEGSIVFVLVAFLSTLAAFILLLIVMKVFHIPFDDAHSMFCCLFVHIVQAVACTVCAIVGYIGLTFDRYIAKRKLQMLTDAINQYNVAIQRDPVDVLKIYNLVDRLQEDKNYYESAKSYLHDPKALDLLYDTVSSRLSLQNTACHERLKESKDLAESYKIARFAAANGSQKANLDFFENYFKMDDSILNKLEDKEFAVSVLRYATSNSHDSKVRDKAVILSARFSLCGVSKDSGGLESRINSLSEHINRLENVVKSSEEEEIKNLAKDLIQECREKIQRTANFYLYDWPKMQEEEARKTEEKRRADGERSREAVLDIMSGYGVDSDGI